ncbi:MAG TPA: hypothetical protein ENN21_08135 [Spirochaetes bacterium]|nr:hypothetical protein [Spirochaetota bacterium]
MKKIVSLMVIFLFIAGVSVMAQGKAAAPVEEKKIEKKAVKKAPAKKVMKKKAVKKAEKAEEKKMDEGK